MKKTISTETKTDSYACSTELKDFDWLNNWICWASEKNGSWECVLDRMTCIKTMQTKLALSRSELCFRRYEKFTLFRRINKIRIRGRSWRHFYTTFNWNETIRIKDRSIREPRPAANCHYRDQSIFHSVHFTSARHLDDKFCRVQIADKYSIRRASSARKQQTRNRIQARNKYKN